MNKKSLAACLASVMLLMFGAQPTVAASPVHLIPHTAVYDLELSDASERSGIDGMTGRMVYQFEGGDCTGYTVNFRLVTVVDTQGERRTTDQWTTTFEDIKSGRFSFDTKSYAGDSISQEVRGEAKQEGQHLGVKLTAPDQKAIKLAFSRFPTEHMREVIERARKGETFFEARLFDGADEGDKSMIAATVLGDRVEPKRGRAGNDVQNAGPLSNESYWPVSIAYYDEANEDDPMPTYRMSFKLYENGVSRDLVLDYGDFVLTGNLAKLELAEPDTCQ